MERKKNLKWAQYGRFKFYKGKQQSKENQKNTFFHLIMLLLRSRTEFDDVWRFSYQRIGPKCGEPRTKGKLSPQSSSKIGWWVLKPLFTLRQQPLADWKYLRLDEATKAQPACTVWCLLLKYPRVAKKMRRLGGFQSNLAWEKYAHWWRLMPRKQPNQRGNNWMYTESSAHVPPRCAAPLPSLHAQPLPRRRVFLGSPSSQVKWPHTGRTALCCPICSSSLLQLLTREVVGIPFFSKRKTWFSVQRKPTWPCLRFIGLWNAQRCICTLMLRFDHLRDTRQHVTPWSFVRLRCLRRVAMATFLGQWGGQILLLNAVIIYFDC